MHITKQKIQQRRLRTEQWKFSISKEWDNIPFAKVHWSLHIPDVQTIWKNRGCYIGVNMAMTQLFADVLLPLISKCLAGLSHWHKIVDAVTFFKCESVKNRRGTLFRPSELHSGKFPNILARVWGCFFTAVSHLKNKEMLFNINCEG